MVKFGLGGLCILYKWNRFFEVKFFYGSGNRVCKKDDIRRNKKIKCSVRSSMLYNV